MKDFKAFTLAETLTVLILIGIIATISLPTVIHKHSESVKRVKIKKAMAMYDSAIHAMYDGQGFLTKQAFLNWASSEPNCANTKVYFKRADAMQFHNSEEKSGCVFKTVDNIWWDISDISNPIVILNEGFLSCLDGTYQNCTEEGQAAHTCCTKDTLYEASKNPIETDTNVFTMSFQVDDETGMLHINDKNYEEGFLDNYNNRAYMTKLFSFIYDKKFTSEVHIEPQPQPEPEPELNDLCVHNGWNNTSDNGTANSCPTDYTGMMANCTNGETTQVKYCTNGSNYTSSTPNVLNVPSDVKEPKPITCNNQSIGLIMNNGVITEVQYFDKDYVSSYKPLEVFQNKGSNGNRIVKYYYNGNTFKQAWWYNTKKEDFSWMTMQYEYTDDSGKTTYYYLITDGTSVSKAYSSNKPFYHNGSQIFLSDGTQNNVITSSTSIASITGNNCNINADFCKAMSNAKQDGYFTKPVKNDYITLSNISIDFDNYYKCLMQQ